MKRVLSLVLALALVLGLGTTALAAESGFSDVDSGAWYAEAVEYCRENGLMSGVSGTRFAPNNTMTRAMLVTALYRRAGSPAVSGQDRFADTADGQWYTDAVLWASQNGIVSGYSSTQFGTNDPVTREQLVTILYRIAGEPETQTAEAFADQDNISGYAVSAVAWARVNGVVNGKDGNRFDPKGNATRAEVATVLMNEAKRTDQTPNPNPDRGSNILVAYFSATGSTEKVANYIAEELNADTFEMVPVNEYTSADLNWTNPSSRVNAEHNDESKRDIELVKTTPDNWENYDVVFVGYPIWWSDMPMILYTFFDRYDFSGKTLIPFGTHGGSGWAGTPATIARLESNANILEGLSISRDVIEDAHDQIVDWVYSLGI